MRKVVGIFLVAAVGLSAHAVHATKIIILSGTFSQDQVAKDCAAIEGGGGGFFTTPAGGYGCVNNNNGNSVQCNSKGKCTGTIFRKVGPSRPTLGGVLGLPTVAR